MIKFLFIAAAVIFFAICWIVTEVAFEKAPDDPSRRHVPISPFDIMIAVIFGAMGLGAVAFAVWG